MITLSDLKTQGFGLTKEEAIELHSKINEIAQRGDHASVNVVYEGTEEKESGRPDDETLDNNESTDQSEEKPKSKPGRKPKAE